MIQEKPLSIIEITQELNVGTATIKFILKRFSQWLPFDRIDGHHYYSRNTIPVLIKIKESMDAGMLPSEIDQELKTFPQKDSDHGTDSYFSKQPNEDIRISKDGLSLIKLLFDDIAIQQNRVATAHEKRAAAEERKATAIEKRAEAEEKKAMAMNNIANALQEMNRHRINDSQAGEIAFQAAQVMTVDETSDIALPELNNNEQVNEQEDISEIFTSPDPSFDLLEASEIDMDDLSDLIKEEMLLDDPLVGVQNIPGKMEEQPEKKGPKPDDLYALIDQKIEEAPGLDDLSKLLDPEPHLDDMDDLSTLIDTISTQGTRETDPKIDDLSLLIDDISSAKTPVDNLSLLVKPQKKEQAQISVEIDDLSLLIEPEPLAPLDDLAALISDTPSLKPDITPEKNLKEYKAAVMKTILSLKTEGLNAKESTNRLNQDGVQTISGKPKWSEKAISQIYKFIDSAK